MGETEPRSETKQPNPMRKFDQVSPSRSRSIPAEANRRSKLAVAEDAERAAARRPPKRRPARPDAKGDAGLGAALGVGREEGGAAASAAGLEIAAAAAAETRVEEPVVERERRVFVRGGMAATRGGEGERKREVAEAGSIDGRECWKTRGESGSKL
jgi:hypothetical protein